MNKLLLILLALLCVSCASGVKRFGTEKRVPMKTFYTKVSNDYQGHYDFLGYTQGRGNHCFESVDDREVVTVLASDLDKAVNHFFFRKVTYNVTKTVVNGNTVLKAEPIEDTRVSLEVAYCTEQYKHLLGNNQALYASFRVER